MFRFKKVNDKLYKYRGVDVKIQADQQGKAIMIANIEESDGEKYQIYCSGLRFESVKQSVINRIDNYIDERSNGMS